MTLCNVYTQLNLMVGDSFKQASLPSGHYWIIPLGSTQHPMPIEILIFYDIFSAEGRIETPKALRDRLVTLVDSVYTPSLGDPIGQVGDVIMWNGDKLQLINWSQ